MVLNEPNRIKNLTITKVGDPQTKCMVSVCNYFLKPGNNVFQQVIGTPMVLNPAPCFSICLPTIV